MPKVYCPNIKFFFLLPFIFLLLILTPLKIHALNSNIVVNPDMETYTNNEPDSWYQDSYDNIEAIHEYKLGGYASTSHSLNIDVKSTMNGAARWIGDRVPVDEGETYTLSDMYFSNTYTYTVLETKFIDGSREYRYMKVLPANTNWKKFSYEYTVPKNASEIRFWHEIDSVGFLNTDLYEIRKSSLTTPIISVTFDDGWDSIYANAFQVMKQYNIKSTQYLVSSWIDTEGFMSTSQINEFIAAGHEIGSHTVSHPFLTTLTASQLTQEIVTSKSQIQSLLGLTPTSLAIPYGWYNNAVLSQGIANFDNVRTSDEGWNNLTNFSARNIKIQYITLNTSIDEFNSWINEAKLKKTWLVLLYHQVNDSNDEYSVTKSTFENQMKTLVSSGISIKPIENAIAEIRSQL